MLSRIAVHAPFDESRLKYLGAINKKKHQRSQYCPSPRNIFLPDFTHDPARRIGDDASEVPLGQSRAQKFAKLAAQVELRRSLRINILWLFHPSEILFHVQDCFNGYSAG
jgi:hypothetical protein